MKKSLAALLAVVLAGMALMAQAAPLGSPGDIQWQLQADDDKDKEKDKKDG